MVGIIVFLYFLSEMIHNIILLDGLTPHVVMFFNFVLQTVASPGIFKLTPNSETAAQSFDADWLVVLQHVSCP